MTTDIIKDYRYHKRLQTKSTYQGAKNSTTQRSLLLTTNSSKFWEFSSTEALGSGFSLDPPVAFPLKRSFNSALICTRTMEWSGTLIFREFYARAFYGQMRRNIINSSVSDQSMNMLTKAN